MEHVYLFSVSERFPRQNTLYSLSHLSSAHFAHRSALMHCSIDILRLQQSQLFQASDMPRLPDMTEGDHHHCHMLPSETFMSQCLEEVKPEPANQSCTAAKACPE